MCVEKMIGFNVYYAFEVWYDTHTTKDNCIDMMFSDSKKRLLTTRNPEGPCGGEKGKKISGRQGRP
jgi:hypothetical protein